MNLVQVDTFPEAPAAYMAQGMLKANGIDAVVDGNALSGIYPGTTPAWINLYVPADQAEKARQLLSAKGDD